MIFVIFAIFVIVIILLYACRSVVVLEFGSLVFHYLMFDIPFFTTDKDWPRPGTEQ